MRESSLYKQTSGPARVGFGFRVPGRCPNVSESKIDEDPRVGQVVHAIGVFGVSPPIMIFIACARHKPDILWSGRVTVRPHGGTADIAQTTCARPIGSAQRRWATAPPEAGFATFEVLTYLQGSCHPLALIRRAVQTMPYVRPFPKAAWSSELAVALPRLAHPLQVIPEALLA